MDPKDYFDPRDQPVKDKYSRPPTEAEVLESVLFQKRERELALEECGDSESRMRLQRVFDADDDGPDEPAKAQQLDVLADVVSSKLYSCPAACLPIETNGALRLGLAWLLLELRRVGK